METSAVYWESRIKTYGFQKTVDLSLIELILRAEQVGDWSYGIHELDEPDVMFNLTLAQRSRDNKLHLYFVFQYKWERKIIDHLRKKMQKDDGGLFRVQSKVALMHFQGPHFGDRYGIADTAFRLLSDNDIPIFVSGCSGSAIHIVLPEDRLEAAERFLSSAFEVPQTVNFRGPIIIHDPSSKQ